MIKKTGNKLRAIFVICLSLSVLCNVSAVKASSISVDQLYTNAYSATQNAMSLKNQKSINNARTAISSLLNTNASWAVGEFSKQVDQIQQPILVKIVQAISNAQANPSQTNVNSAKQVLDADLPSEWRNAYSSAIDTVEQTLMKNAEAAVNKAVQSKLQNDIDVADVLISDIETSTDSQISLWASNLKAQINTNRQLIKFKDKNLEQVVRDTINKPTGDLYDKDVQSITRLNASGKEISDLAGIESLTNLGWLSLNYNQISDINPLKKLTKLTYLSIDILKPEDISWLEGNIPNLNICGTLDKAQVTTLTSKINSILGKIIKPEMSQVDKELAIHDYIIANTDYDVPGSQSANLPLEDSTAYEILVNGKGVCSGYAKAFALLCNFQGVPCQVVEDDKINHAWNIVKLQNSKYYQVDVTWDDPTSNDANVKADYLEHTYFNISDKQMFADHDIDTSDWNSEDYPKCNTDSDEFYSKQDVATDGEWVYVNKSDKLYAVNAAGDNVLISNDNAIDIIYKDYWIYYINANDNQIYRIDRTGNNSERISENNAYNMYLYDNNLFFLDGDDWNIYKLDLNSESLNEKKVVEVSSSNYGIVNGYLYYKYSDDKNKLVLHKLNLTTGEDIAILKSQTSIKIYGIDDKYVYYKSNNDLYKMTINGENPQLIVSSVDGGVDIFDGWIYYKSLQDGKWYRVSLNGIGNVELITLR